MGVDDFIQVWRNGLSNGIVRSIKILNVPAVVYLGHGTLRVGQSHQRLLHFSLVGKEELSFGFPNGIRNPAQILIDSSALPAWLIPEFAHVHPVENNILNLH